MSAYKYAVVLHSRWDESEEPKATVIRSVDGLLWHDVCVCDPETAQEIAEALEAVEGLSRVRSLADRLACALLYGPFEGEDRRERWGDPQWNEVHDALDAWEEDWRRG